ncbi:TnsD family Tn7-like transposition protein [Bacillus cereus]|uniref:TnsD family Tn7-like transposition protein n=1 Tax=Bacillus thuringiensis TaxID=1428 RepID=UPI002AB3A564|nr:TnsD family Tn7-like transposition protein [Bacillus thuringiensis]MDY8163455.1 TnsD family Tn7-like transposition protein [Bacillus thuringiensis]MEC1984514.1 TnsD family Tn7-like transposition protein [Bacillus cereus]
MLSFFPTFYEDELIYSAIARYHVRSGNNIPKQTVLDLFDGEVTRVYPGIPMSLKILHEKVNSFFGSDSLEEWINNHTMYNYISNFGREKMKDNLLEVMQGNLKMNVGRETHFHSNLKFRYCPKCVVDDYEKYGETYWRRNHQLTGVFICLTHQELLRSSDVLWSPFYKGNIYKVETANLINCPLQRESIYNVSEENMKWLIKLTKQCIKVATREIPIKFDEITDTYRALLYKKRYKRGKLVELKQLYRDFRDFYGDEILSFLNVNFDEGKRSNWLATIAKKNKQTFHPLKHILFITFLGEDMDTFYRFNNVELHSFGAPPYICLNPFSSHYLQPVIKEATLYTQEGRELCYFACNCGFEFTREVGDTKIRVCQIKNIGSWESDFEYLYENFRSNTNSRNPKQHYNLYKKYVYYKNGQNLKGIKKNPEEYKKKWLAAMKQFPEYSTECLKHVYRREYTFLYRHCRNWLKENSPSIKNRGIRSVDWTEKDWQLLNEIKIAVQRLLHSEKPQRITRNRLKREIVDSTALHLKFSKNLPETESYLNSVVESIEQFQIRRVEYALEKLTKNGRSLTYSTICRAANISEKSIKLGTRQKVLEIVDNGSFDN